MAGQALKLEAKKISLLVVSKQTLVSLLYPQVVLLFLIPFLISVILVAVMFWLTWGFWYGWMQHGFQFINPWWQNILSYLPVFIADALATMGPFATLLLVIFLFAVVAPLILVLNLTLTSILASSYLVQFLAHKDFKNLEKKGSARLIGGIYNTVTSGLLFIIMWFVTLPLWLIPGAQLLLPVLLTAWLNKRVGLFDALAEFASVEEIAFIKQQYSGQAYVLGLLTTVFNFLPFAILFSPVFALIAFTYFGLSVLRECRDDCAAIL